MVGLEVAPTNFDHPAIVGKLASYLGWAHDLFLITWPIPILTDVFPLSAHYAMYGKCYSPIHCNGVEDLDDPEIPEEYMRLDSWVLGLESTLQFQSHFQRGHL
jgi:hypothetical protein